METRNKSKYIKLIYFIFAMSALFYSLSFAFEQYIEVKKHNLEVISQMRLQCIEGLKGINIEGVNLASQACFERVTKEYIGEWK